MPIDFDTNNAAKLQAVRQGLSIAWELDYKFIDLQISFDIVICWLTSNETTTLPMVPLIWDCRALLSRAWTVLPRHIFREANNIADGLAKRGVMQRNSLVEYVQYSTFVINPYIWDLLEKKNSQRVFLNILECQTLFKND